MASADNVADPDRILTMQTPVPHAAQDISRRSTSLMLSRKSLQSHGSTNKTLIEAGAITCVKLCKAATYINVLDSNNVICSLVQTVINDLKNLLFKVENLSVVVAYS